MYTSIFYDREKNRIHLWDSKIGYKSFPYKKYAYIEDEDGEYTTIFGKKVKKITNWEKSLEENNKLYESDISPEMRVLIDLYYDADDNEYPENKIAILDIEVETDNTFPDVSAANNKITSICLYYYNDNTYHTFILDKDFKLQHNNINTNGKNIVIYGCINESELLEDFLSLIEKIRPTIITGWNIDNFDIPYLIRRMNRVVGPHNTKRLSSIGIIHYSEFKKKFSIAGISLLDYLLLYKKFTFSEEPSYKLDAIATKELGRGKTKFDGSLQNLYETNIEKFVEYNINDVELIFEIDNKKKFLDLVIGICHKGKIPYEDIYYSSKYLEGAILCDLKRNNLIAPNKISSNNKGEKFSGAYVKIPIPGIYEWVFDLDLTSLYPSIIMSLNISPETKIGKILNWDKDKFYKGDNVIWKLYNFKFNKEVEVDTDTLKKLLEDTKFHISSNGILYLPSSIKRGVIPKILSNWFNERIQYKNLMKKYGKENNIEKYDFYNKLQNIQKVLLNSLYGVLGLPVFRFYDIDNAEAVTTSGQTIIKHSEKKANEYFNKVLDTQDKDYCIYIDTDSLFLSATPILNKLYKNDLVDEKKTVSNVLKITTEVQTFINNSYSEFAKKFFNIQEEHKFQIKQELICRSALWTAKKRYAQWVINKEGIIVDMLDVKGIDVVRSSFPPAFKTFMENLLIKILKGVPKDSIDNDILELEKNLNKISIEDISKNTSINDINKYTENDSRENKYYKDRIFSTIYKGTPAHVRAAIFFNDLLSYFNLDKKYNKIRNGEKIKWCYLKNNEFGIDKIAFRGYEDPLEIIEFIKNNIDKKQMYESELKTKIEIIYNAIGWKFPSITKKLSEQFFKFE